MCPDFTSPNKITKAVDLDGITLTLAVDLNFYRTFQKLTGRNLFSGEAGPIDAEQMAAMIYCSARSGRSEILKNLTHEQGIDLIGEVVHMTNLRALTEAVRDLMMANSAKGEADTGPLAETTPAESPIG